MDPAQEHVNDQTFTPDDDSELAGDHSSGGFYNQTGGFMPYSPAPVTFQHESQHYTHYVPPSAISTRYYALSNPYTYTAEQPAAMHAGNPLPAEAATAGTPATAQPAVTAEGSPQASSTSVSTARADPVLPKQRRNRDDPGGESRPLAQPTTQHEDQPARRAPTAYGMPAGGASFRFARAQTPPPIVPSQWKLGAALDQLRFNDRADDRTTAMIAPTGEPYPPMRPGPSSPLSTEDAARLADLKMRLGLHDDADRASTSAAGPSSAARAADPSPTTSTPGTDSEGDYVMNKFAIYSPTTGRKLALSGEPGGKASVQIVPGTTSAKRPYKRGTPVACTFCRKRKIACGGPQEGDEARRCGPCIQRQQACEFPLSMQRPHSRNRHSAGYTGPVIVREFK